MSLGKILRQHAFLALLVAVFMAVSLWMSQYHSVSVHDEKAWSLFQSFLHKVPQMIFVVLVFRLVQLTYVDRDPNRIQTLMAEVKGFVTDRARMTSGFLAALLVTLTLVAFAQLKNLIPALNPFAWDEYFMTLDKALHFGQLPHVYLQAIFGWSPSLTFFTGLYNIWLIIMYFVVAIACFQRPENPFRMQYLIAFLLTWAFGGNLAAIYFSSAGPVYYANLGLGDTYAGLMQLLQDHAANAPVTVIETQDLLWQLSQPPQSVSGISAFPSMHVALSTLMAIYAFKHGRLLGWLMTVFAILIMIGSVLLAWHYAVDGYAGALIAGSSWFVAGWLVRWTSPAR